jgi:hypothetical protein
MTKDENRQRKAAIQQEELHDEFADYLAPNKIFKQQTKSSRKDTEKLEAHIHKTLHLLALSRPYSHERNLQRLVRHELKMAEKMRGALDDGTCMLGSVAVMSDALKTLNTKVETLEDKIAAPFPWYHFYKDPNPAEAKLVHNPIMQLLSRLKVVHPVQLVDAAERVPQQPHPRVLCPALWQAPDLRRLAHPTRPRHGRSRAHRQ